MSKCGFRFKNITFVLFNFIVCFNMKRFITFGLFFSIVLTINFLSAQIPVGYYSAANGKAGEALKTAIFNIIRTHTQLDYYASGTTYFYQTDWRQEGYFWDMYSNNHRTSFSGLNREHSLPKSWFGVASGQENSIPMGTDLHNLYPSDATANSAKSNYPLGEVTGTPEFNNFVKVGPSTNYVNQSPSYSGNVFEPANEYKGDFARDYMYMVTCYEDYSSRWQSLGTSSMLLGGTFPVFRPNAVALLLKWHRQDTVSMKEINRNNAVYKLQKNRNPFIDHPELAEFIWGKYVGSPWDMTGVLPEENTPLEILPNPADTKFKVKLNKPGEATYFIKDLSGVVLKSNKFTVAGSYGSVNVDDLKDGTYILLVYTATTRKVSKFFVQHSK